AVREDPVRPGLLFLATEHGVYVSFNDGDHWQSLQLNLPDTPIRDLVVKNDDVVLGSHGRGFWILDDIGPLRQIDDARATSSAFLFQPSNAIRGVYDAVIQYYLEDQADSVTIEILDAQGEVISSHTGTESEYKPNPDTPWWLRGGSGTPTTARGLNQFTWDLRYPGATTFDGMIIWSARPARGPKAPPGQYAVRMRVGDEVREHAFEVEMDPNLKGISTQDLQEQFELAMQIRDKTSAAIEAVILIRSIRSQIETRLAKTDHSDVQRQATAVIDQMRVIEEDLYQVRNQSNQDPLNFPIKLNNLFASLRRSVETGDARPTDGAYQVFAELTEELDGHLSRLQQIINGDLATLNGMLESNNLQPVQT
ncbi:MAG: glycosyl hydrolase, partial [Saprospiraceae bacterium]|nr:glycosyl hydrolase [Saprospiraceae bacterium]